MAAIALTANGVINDAESITGWTGDSFVLEPDIKVEGSNSVSWIASNNGTNDAYIAGSWNLTGTHIRLYINLSHVGYWAASNAVQIWLTGGSSAYVTVINSASDYSGGWYDAIIDTSAFSGVTLSSVTQVGLRVNTSSKPRNVINSWVDNWRYFNGVEVYSSTTEAVSLTDAAALDAASAYGGIKLQDGVLFCPSEIILGSSGSANANIVSSNETVVFPDRNVTSSLYKLKTEAGTGGTTDISISGMVCKTVGSTGAEIDFQSTLNTLSVSSSSFISMGTVTITPTVTSPTFESNSFTSCGATTLGIDATGCLWSVSGQVTLSGSPTLTGCTFDESTAAVAVVAGSLDQLDGCTFVSDGTGHAVNLGTIAASTSMTWNCTATGYAASDGSTGNETVLVNVASGQTLTINNSGSALSVYNTGSGTVSVISGAVTVKVTAQTVTGTKLQDARVRLTKTVGGAVILNGLTDANGVLQDTAYTYTSDEAVQGWVRKSSASPYYQQAILSGTITSTGLSITAILIEDE